MTKKKKKTIKYLLIEASKKQMEQMRLIYKMLIATKYYNVTLEHLPNLNPKWLQLLPIEKEGLRLWKPIKIGQKEEHGFFEIERTKKSFIIRVNHKWVVSANKLKRKQVTI